MASSNKLDLSVAALLVLAESGVPADMQELLVRGNSDLGVKAGVLDALIDAVLKATEEKTNWELKELRDQNAAMKATIEAHESDQETLLGYVTSEEQLAFDPDDKWATSIFISDRQTDLFQYPVYRAPVTRNRILEGVQEICAAIIKDSELDDAHSNPAQGKLWRGKAAVEISGKIDELKNHEFFPYERTEVHLVEHDDDAFLAVRNLLMPSFTGLYVLARRPKLMTNDEWRPVAHTIIDALRRKGPVNYPVAAAKEQHDDCN